jgi:hypothetical protein
VQPPTVQGLDQIIAELNPAYAPRENLLNTQRSGLGIKYDSQRSALGAEKVQGFNQINNQATGRGLSFSGIPLDEQATYLSTKYLPGMQNLASQQNSEDMQLQTALAGIDSERRLRAMDTRQGQQSSLEKYLAEERDRQFRQQEAEKERQAKAREAAASRASSAPRDISGIVNNIGGLLSGKAGSDGFVHPNVFQQGKQAWVAAGGDPDSFNQTYARYINPNHYWEYTGKK